MMEEAGILGLFLGSFSLFFLVIWLFFFAVAMASLVFWVIMIVDVAKRKFTNESEKIIWVLIVVLAGAIGALVYYFVVKRPNKRKVF